MPSTLWADWPLAIGHHGCSRRLAPADDWRTIGEALHRAEISLLDLWGDGQWVHAALHDAGAAQVVVASIPVANGRVPSLGIFHAPAIRLERALQDLHGIEITALPDARPWLDHDRWSLKNPLGIATAHAATAARMPEFLQADGPSLHQIPVGPVHAGIIEPGHFRFSAHGETIGRLEERLGYVHRGVEKLMQGCNPGSAARIAARISGDSTVAFGWAFSRAVEIALGFEPPPRAIWLRAVMAELERIANHLGDIGAICNDASFALMHIECGILRENVLRSAAVGFGHRLMMDRIVPGGVTTDLGVDGAAAIRDLLRGIERRLPELGELYDNTASLQDRTVDTGRLAPDLARTFACGGFIGRASGRSFDARRNFPYAPYDTMPPEVTTLTEGDVDARVRVRFAEIRASAQLLARLLDSLPEGAISRTDLPRPTEAVEATAMVEGFRGDILAYVRLDADLLIQRCHLRDPSWFQWPLLEVAIEGNIVADFPLCNKSFNCSYSGHDL